MERILIVQTSFLGDVVLSTPVIKRVAEAHPDAEIWLMTTPLASAIVRNDPLVKGVISYDKAGRDSGLRGTIKKAGEVKAFNFSTVYSLHRSFRTAILLFLSGIKKRVGFKESRLSFLYSELRHRAKDAPHDVIKNLSLVPSNDQADRDAELRVFLPPVDPAARVKEELGLLKGKYAVIAPGSVWETKKWLADRFGKVGKGLIDAGLKVVLVGSNQDIPAADKAAKEGQLANLCGRTDISEMISLVRDAALLVCNDSFPLHLGSAFKVPTVALFCSTVPEFGFGPWKNNSVVLEVDNLSCRPCGRHGRRSCPTGTQACMIGIPTDSALSACKKLLRLS
jgi:heptosyltransferase-2